MHSILNNKLNSLYSTIRNAFDAYNVHIYTVSVTHSERRNSKNLIFICATAYIHQAKNQTGLKLV